MPNHKDTKQARWGLQKRSRNIMQIKIIYEDEAVLPVKDLIGQLDSQQLFFVEQFIKQQKQQRKQMELL